MVVERGGAGAGRARRRLPRRDAPVRPARAGGPRRSSPGCVLLVAALVTPLDTLAREYLVWAHLLQNVVLAEWAPLLLVLGIPPDLAGRLTRPRDRRGPDAAVRRSPALGRRPTPCGTFLRSTTPRFATRRASCRSSTRPTSSRASCSGGASGRTRRTGSRPGACRATSSRRSSSRRPSGWCSRSSPSPLYELLRRRGRARLGALAPRGPAARRDDDGGRAVDRLLRRLRAAGSRASSPSRSVSRK